MSHEQSGASAGVERRLSSATLNHLQAIESMQKATLTDYKKQIKKKKDRGQKGPHVPKTQVDRRHKILLFGRVYRGIDEEEERLYQFIHQRADGVVSEGYIPVGFLSMLPVEDEYLYLAVRKSPMGPEFQVSHKTEKQVICDWDLNPDAMWASVVTQFDKRDLFSERTMNYLDADPFVLFGVDDLITQKALRKLERQSVLLCRGAKPDSQEWFSYLELDPVRDEDLTWVVQSFAEVELPAPWTSYKGIGSVVCFLNHQTGKTTWKHPFYEYFMQMKEFALTAMPDQVKQCRLNRLIWSYETQGPSGQLQEPLVSPEYVEMLAEIMGYDLAAEPYLVRDLKTYLKIFAHSYRTNEDVALQDVIGLQEAVAINRSRADLQADTWNSLRSLPVDESDYAEMAAEEAAILNRLSNGEVACVECGAVALSYCSMFEDYFCLACFAKLHQKGARKNAKAYKLDVCCLCRQKAAKLECTYSYKLFCLECFAMRHVKDLPLEAKECAPNKLVYYRTRAGDMKTGKEGSGKGGKGGGHGHGHGHGGNSWDEEPGEEIGRLAQEWVPFFDAKGIQFYYNFSTGERMRRSPRASAENSENNTPRGGKSGPGGHGLSMDDNMGHDDQVRGLDSALEALDGDLYGDDGQGARAKKNKEQPPLPRSIKPPYRTDPAAQ